MDVNINQARCNDASARIQRLVFATRLRCGYFAIREPEIGDLVAFLEALDGALPAAEWTTPPSR
jgi:hypothetical protein